MNYVDQIKEGKVAQGDLTLIFHTKKPVKTGWYRKVRCGESEDNNIVYILEKPLHKDFSLNHKDIKSTRIEHGMCMMKASTVRDGWNGECPYEILIDARGIAQGYIVANNYLIDANVDIVDRLLYGKNMPRDLVITERGAEFLQEWTKSAKQNDIKKLVNDLR